MLDYLSDVGPLCSYLCAHWVLGPPHTFFHSSYRVSYFQTVGVLSRDTNIESHGLGESELANVRIGANGAVNRR